MKKKFILLLVICTSIILTGLQTVTAQSWVITGNNNTTALSKLGTTNFIPLGLYTNNLQRIHIDELGRVGIGTSAPLNLLTLQSNGSTPASSWLAGGSTPVFLAFAEEMATGFNLATAANASGLRPVLNTRRSRGTLASPTAVANNDYLASFVCSGYDGSTFQNPATIDFYADGTPSSGHVPGRISFVTGTNAGDRAERLKVQNDGNFDFNSGQMTLIHSTGDVGIGTSSPEAKLHVSGGSAGSVTAQGNAQLVVENSTHNYINILAPTASETGILFGSPTSN